MNFSEAISIMYAIEVGSSIFKGSKDLEFTAFQERYDSDNGSLKDRSFCSKQSDKSWLEHWKVHEDIFDKDWLVDIDVSLYGFFCLLSFEIIGVSFSGIYIYLHKIWELFLARSMRINRIQYSILSHKC